MAHSAKRRKRATRIEQAAKELEQAKKEVNYQQAKINIRDSHLRERCEKVRQCEDKIEQQQKELERHRWIPVSERLPENIATVWVLLYAKATETLCPALGYYGEDIREDGWGWGWELEGNGLLTEIAYWKPIILPKAEELL